MRVEKAIKETNHVLIASAGLTISKPKPQNVLRSTGDYFVTIQI